MLRSARYRAVVHFALLLLVALAGVGCTEDDDDNELAADRAFFTNRAAEQPKTVTPGPSATPVGATATAPPKNLRYATAAPIEASFDQASFTTTYKLSVTGAFPEGGLIRWSGPNCGTVIGDRYRFAPEQSFSDEVSVITFRWTHPHPPCERTSNHSDVTVTATMTEGSGEPGRTPLVTTVCTYPGSDTGRGPSCQIAR